MVEMINAAVIRKSDVVMSAAVCKSRIESVLRCINILMFSRYSMFTMFTILGMCVSMLTFAN